MRRSSKLAQANAVDNEFKCDVHGMYTHSGLSTKYLLRQWTSFVLAWRTVTQSCPPPPPIALAVILSHCTVTENSGKGFTKQNIVLKRPRGKEKESERNIRGPLPVFTLAILANLSKLRS